MMPPQPSAGEGAACWARNKWVQNLLEYILQSQPQAAAAAEAAALNAICKMQCLRVTFIVANVCKAKLCNCVLADK
jgi:hypothetical protein